MRRCLSTSMLFLMYTVYVQIRSEEFLLPVRNPQSMDSARISHLLLSFPPPSCKVACRYGDGPCWSLPWPLTNDLENSLFFYSSCAHVHVNVFKYVNGVNVGAQVWICNWKNICFCCTDIVLVVVPTKSNKSGLNGKSILILFLECSGFKNLTK